ncbi:MAG: UbiA family prenyltransferase [Saprospiraceae bacterium]
MIKSLLSKITEGLLKSNIYISLAAVFLTIESQIQLGLNPQWHPYLFLIFFATLFEYNIHRFVTIITNTDALNSIKHNWVKENKYTFYVLVLFSVAGFIAVTFLAKKVVLITLAPIALLTLFYSLPVSGNKTYIFRLREIPYLKIFLIASVWSSATILLPAIQSEQSFSKVHVMTMLLERFFFIFSITIPFDIRDIEADKQAGLKTIPLLLDEKKSIFISNLSLGIFFTIAAFHYSILKDWHILLAMGISAITTLLFLNNKKIRNLPYYHYGILDGTMLLQGILVTGLYYLILQV